MNIIYKNYIQPNNLLIKFTKDNLDQTKTLLNNLQSRANDNSKAIELLGNHLTPSSGGIRDFVLNEIKNENTHLNNKLNDLIDIIHKYAVEQVNG